MAASRKPSFMPRVEVLEDRQLLSASQQLPEVFFENPGGKKFVEICENGRGFQYVYVRCKGPMQGKVTVDLVPEDLTATGDKDYKISGIKKTLSFSAKDCLKRIKFPVINDGEPEEDEKVRLRLVKPRGCKLGSANKQTVLIKDNDAKLKVWDLTFQGEGFGRITKDDGSRDYVDKHWLDLNHDGVADPQAGEQRDPVSFAAGSTLGARTTFWMERPAPFSDPTRYPDTCFIRAKGPDGSILIDATQASFEEDEVMRLEAATAIRPFPSTVECYDDFQLTWEYRYRDGKWYPATTTSNHLYVTWQAPQVAPLYHTVVDVGCRAVRGLQTDDQNLIVGAIWLDFQDRQVVTAVERKQLTYWGDPKSQADTTSALLKTGSGQCGAWADFFIDVLRAQGITSARKVEVLGPETDKEPDGRAWLLVREWTFQGSGSVPGRAPYAYEVGVDVLDGPGLPGQGNPNPPSTFKNHFIVDVAGLIYDPSYGAGPYQNVAAWEDASLAGFYYHFKDAAGMVHWYAKKNDPGQEAFFRYV